MKIRVKIWIALSLLAYNASAQNYFGLLNEGNHIVSGGINANPNLNVNADYLMQTPLKGKLIESYGIIANANIPLFSQKGFDFDLRLGAGVLITFWGSLKCIAGLSWNLSRSEDLNGRYIHSGFKLDIFPGYYGARWVFAPHISLSYQPWVNIRHQDYAIKAFQDLYPSGIGQFKAPKNGWFYQNSIGFQTGIAIVFLQPRWNINLMAGFQHQFNKLGIVALPDIGIMPFYGSLNFGYTIKPLQN